MDLAISLEVARPEVRNPVITELFIFLRIVLRHHHICGE